MKNNLGIDEGLAEEQDAELDVGDFKSGKCLLRGCSGPGGHEERTDGADLTRMCARFERTDCDF
jgi:hypothetical protein